MAALTFVKVSMQNKLFVLNWQINIIWMNFYLFYVYLKNSSMLQVKAYFIILFEEKVIIYCMCMSYYTACIYCRRLAMGSRQIWSQVPWNFATVPRQKGKLLLDSPNRSVICSFIFEHLPTMSRTSYHLELLLNPLKYGGSDNCCTCILQLWFCVNLPKD